MNENTVRLLLTGPIVVAALIAALAATALLAGALGRLERLAAVGARAAGCLPERRAFRALWGLAALLLALIVIGVLFKTKVLALLGLLMLLLTLAFAGLGLGVSAARFGRALASALGRPAASPLLCLCLGLATFFLAAFLPLLGWLIVFLALLSGVGEVLEALLRRA